MTRLRDIQASFLHDIYTGECTSLAYLDTQRASPARLDIYRNNTILGLMDILANAFPVLNKIVGDAFFRMMARHYIKIHRQSCGNRHTFGGELGKFLMTFEPAIILPYLPDMAEVEWAYFQAGLAEDARALDFEFLQAAISSDPDFCLMLHPSVHIVPQSFNTYEIWQEHQKEHVSPIELKSSSHPILVWRGREDMVLMRPVSNAMALLLDLSQKGNLFSKAMGAAWTCVQDSQAFQREFAEAVTYGVFARPVKDVA